jgi:hypothetical protein
VRSFSEFNASLSADQVELAEGARLRSLATWGYLLLRPGMEFVRQRSNFVLGWQAAASAGASVSGGVNAGAVGVSGRPSIGSWMMLPSLTSPATRTVLPSNDALYGAAHLELDRLGPVVLTVPANIDDRYFSVSVMDAHMNNLLHVGPRWTGHDAVDVVVAPPGWDGAVPDGMNVVVSPTVSVCCYHRMLVKFGEGDLDRVRAWQAGLRITQLSKWGSADPVPDDVDVADLVHPDLNTSTDAFQYFRIGLDHLARNPMVVESNWLASMVAAAGLPDADPTSPAGAAIDLGVDDATTMLDAALTTWPRVNGWMRPDPRLGLPNPDVLTSAAFQQFQIGSNDILEAAYLFVDTDSDGNPLDASGGATYEVCFGAGEAPPFEPSGYWSLTMYDDRSFLVANPIDRYVVRTDSPGFEPGADGTLRVVVACEPPSGTITPDWLPAPDGRFRLGLRVYYPGAAVLEGQWRPPAVSRID